MSVLVAERNESNELHSLIKEVQELKEALQKRRLIKQQIRGLLQRALLLTENKTPGHMTRTSATYIPIPTRYNDIDIVHVDEKIKDSDIVFDEGVDLEIGLKPVDNTTLPITPWNPPMEYLESGLSNSDTGYSSIMDEELQTCRTVVIEEKEIHSNVVVIPNEGAGFVRQDHNPSYPEIITYQEENQFNRLMSNRSFLNQMQMGGSFRLREGEKSPHHAVDAASVKSVRSESVILMPIRSVSADSAGSSTYVSNSRSDRWLYTVPIPKAPRRDVILRAEIEKIERSLPLNDNESKAERENTKNRADLELRGIEK